MEPILTAIVGVNADLIEQVFKLYVKKGETVADVTYGLGKFWTKIDKSRYVTFLTDIAGEPSVDFRSLPYAAESMDVLILDPPYMHGSETAKESITNCYGRLSGNHNDVVRLYAGGILEAARVLRKKTGRIMVKCQDEIESGKQRLSHVEIKQLLELSGFEIIDLFVLVQNTIPAMREDYQKSARKNHSYLWLARLKS